jgi:hypothetical protein
MAKEKVTLTLDAARLQELRDLVGSRSLSATVNDAVAAHVIRLRHLSAVGSDLAVDAFVVAVADLEGGAIVASVDLSDMERLAAHAARVTVADIA